MALIIGIGGFEWARLCGLEVPGARLYALGIVAAFAALVASEVYFPVFAAAAAFWILAVPAWLWRGVRPEQRRLLAAAGFLVLVPPALAVVLFRPSESLLVLAVAWIADTAAYFAGRRS